MFVNSSPQSLFCHMANEAVDGGCKAFLPRAYWRSFNFISDSVPGTAAKLAREYCPYVVNEGETVSGSQKRHSSLIADNDKKYGGTEDEVYVSGLAYTAGADATSSACFSFLLAMPMFPEVQQRAQTGRDKVVGPSRLQRSQFDVLHTHATAMETMCRVPVLPLGFPHEAIADGPPELEFKPERYLDDSGQINCAVREPTTMPLDFGKHLSNPPQRWQADSLPVQLIREDMRNS
ncbi:hypothetical protein BXZ70DRAFT_905485 [Cristinia sonorae]|uniref:Cytochrome P450 n=1 Tax=Cristinia sonorae TaxID=1940300 RepID=A0A8K0UVJ6_9AGAR|nr:hypothetical protein BXZ70DRAFT_905485 [Cristinia sonorae]